MQPHTENFWSLFLDEREFFRKMCMRWLRGHRHDVEDVLSKGSINAFEYILSHPANVRRFRPWMLRILFNLSIDTSRLQSRFVSCASDDEDGIAVFGFAPDVLDRTLMCEELAGSITRAVQGLPPRLHEVFALRFVEERKYDEISQILLISAQNARKRVQMVREKLKAELRGRV
jgi:RNA polymerase sigma-70 factor (ECF subfamily)